MPILYFLKSPRSTLALQGVIDDKLVRQLAKTLGPIVSGTAMDGKKIVIPAQEDCNITYIKEITQKEFDKAQADIKKNQAEEEIAAGKGKIVRPEFAQGHRRGPGGKRRR